VREQQLKELRRALEGGERANSKLESELARLEQQRARLDAILAEEQEEGRALEARVAALEKELALAKAEGEKASAAHARATTEIEGLKAQAVAAAAEKALIVEGERVATRAGEAMTRELASAQLQIQQLETALARLQARTRCPKQTTSSFPLLPFYNVPLIPAFSSLFPSFSSRFCEVCRD